jgi:hypothetical protein
MSFSRLDANKTSEMEQALADAAVVLAGKAAASDQSAYAERWAHGAALLAHAVKGTEGGGAGTGTPSD